MGKRSPILGYNHNVRHRGLIFHVQTEDSGVDNPHLFTHLFHGGVIIATRRLDYDRGSANDVVKSLMQAQHKAALRELKAGKFDGKITAYLGENPELEPPAPARERPAHDTLETPVVPTDGSDAAGNTQRSPVFIDIIPDDMELVPVDPILASGSEPNDDDDAEPGAPSRTSRTDDVSAAFRAIGVEDVTSPSEARPTQTSAEAVRTGSVPPPIPPAARQRAQSPTGFYSHHRKTESMAEIHDQPTAPVTRSGRIVQPIPPLASRPPAPYPARPAGKPHAPPVPPLRPTGRTRPPPEEEAHSMRDGEAAARAGVIVSRPAVIIGGPPRIVGGRPMDAPRSGRRAREEGGRPSLFGKDLISEKSLDEVILAYLSEDSAEE